MHSSRLSSSSLVRRLLVAGSLALFTLLTSQAAVAQSNSTYQQTNLISDGAVQAMHTDPTLINPWGVSLGPQFWIDSAGSGFSEVDDASGNKAFAVAVPSVSAGATHGSPAGTVANNDSTVFNIPGNGSALFIFGNLDGSIAAWNTNTPQAVTVANNSAAKAAYTDIAIDKNSTGTFLLAANFAGGTVDVFDSNFASTHLTGSFADPSIPQGFAPFGIHSIGSSIYVTYAERSSTGREVLGAGLGYIDIFDNNGNLTRQAISQGNLNAPWGMALAPAGFGSFGGKLLVGNFGDGTINAYDPTNFSFLGQLTDSTGTPITNSGLWEIVFGANRLGDPNTLYFAAGINGEKDGLFGAISVASAPSGTPDFSFQASANALTVTSGQSGNLTINLAASNGFSGTVSFSCTGLPSGDTCTFNPATANVSGASTVSVVTTINTATTSAPAPNPYIAATHPKSSNHNRPVMLLAFGIPFGLLSFAGLRKKSLLLRSSIFSAALMLFTLSMTGCSSKSTAATSTPTPTPAASQLTINATSGAITHTINVSLTVN
ncbi:hypothetical protein GCM10011507_00170 [Edaphobacter acidisoli]|uniref:TIGR03118 family protein n=1 Tax=Edaphobacter acidisoli TaxID=2040573 RepID=A0A916RG44_9BACT|nr:TIGR03118 family protein [Edaphobacter acidisoli]GGA53074.1 hypothetical protein GCM10011507_00170 [Edaphobacter acidisoli]